MSVLQCRRGHYMGTQKFTIIALSGKAQVGKTTLSLMLHKRFPTYHRFSFEDALKQDMAAYFGLRTRELHGDKETVFDLGEVGEKNGIVHPLKLRELLEWYRRKGPQSTQRNYWINSANRVFRLYEAKGMSGLIIDDVLFPDEANLIKRWRGFLACIMPYPDYPLAADEPMASAIALEGYKGFDAIYLPAYGEEALEGVANEIAKALR